MVFICNASDSLRIFRAYRIAKNQFAIDMAISPVVATISVEMKIPKVFDQWQRSSAGNEQLDTMVPELLQCSQCTVADFFLTERNQGTVYVEKCCFDHCSSSGSMSIHSYSPPQRARNFIKPSWLTTTLAVLSQGWKLTLSAFCKSLSIKNLTLCPFGKSSLGSAVCAISIS